MHARAALDPLTLLACLIACGAAPPQIVIAPVPAIHLTSTGLGPLTAKTPANLVALRKVLTGYEVVPVNVDTDPDKGHLEFQVYEGGKLVFVIVPKSDGAILNVHISTPKVAVAGHPWRVGAPFAGAGALTTCECWGTIPVCFKKGEHVAVTFDRVCRGTTEARSRRLLEGSPIKRLVWQPQPFGGDEYGGKQYGGIVEPDELDP